MKTTAWDASEHLTSPEAISAYLAAAFEAAIEDNDQGIIAAALGDAAKAVAGGEDAGQ